MGKSAPSCLKILACGSQSVDHDDLQPAESKASSDRRRWSFRNRSSRHRALSDGVGPELPSSVNKENPEPKSVSFQAEAGLDVCEKAPAVQTTDGKNLQCTQPEIKLSDIIFANKDDSGEDDTFDEAIIIVIQAAIRRFLAQERLLKAKSIIKIQAAVRRHLVRRHAVGTFRCLQAIIRIQALVRAHRALDGSNELGKQIETNKGEKVSRAKSMEKLLSNAFAHQLMESVPRTKAINIKCEPSKSDSSWEWLQRWTSLATISKMQLQESGSAATKPSYAENPVDFNVLVVSEPATDIYPDSVQGPASAEASEGESKQNFNDANEISSHPQEQAETGSAPTEVKETDLTNIEVAESLEKEEPGLEDLEAETKMVIPEQPVTEVKRFPRKASNPTFLAAQSKFEDMASAPVAAKSASFSSYDSGVKSRFNKYSSATDISIKSRDTALADDAISTATAAAICGSECGTELSLSSAFDFGSETVNSEIQQQTEVPYEANDVSSEWNSKHGTQNEESHPSQELEKEEDLKLGVVESLNPSKDLSQLERTPAETQHEPQLELASDTNQQVNKLSPETSPRSHVTVPESLATPPSQVSADPKKKKSDRKGRPVISKKRSHLSLNQESASRTSLEYSQEHKSGKRRSSFSSEKPDHRDQEPRNSSSSTSLPGYMQATESARAKAIASASPRSSPDVQDKDIFFKKRHSLPSLSERQGSPRIQRSLSQAQQNGKGNETQSPQDRKCSGDCPPPMNPQA